MSIVEVDTVFNQRVREIKDYSGSLKGVESASTAVMRALHDVSKALGKLSDKMALLTKNKDFDDHLRAVALSMQRDIRAFSEADVYTALNTTVTESVIVPSKRLRSSTEIILQVAKKRKEAREKVVKYDKKLHSYERKIAKSGNRVPSKGHMETQHKHESWSVAYEEKQGSFDREYLTLMERSEAELPRMFGAMLSSTAQFHLNLSSKLIALSQSCQKESHQQHSNGSPHRCSPRISRHSSQASSFHSLGGAGRAPSLGSNSGLQHGSGDYALAGAARQRSNHALSIGSHNNLSRSVSSCASSPLHSAHLNSVGGGAHTAAVLAVITPPPRSLSFSSAAVSNGGHGAVANARHAAGFSQPEQESIFNDADEGLEDGQRSPPGEDPSAPTRPNTRCHPALAIGPHSDPNNNNTNGSNGRVGGGGRLSDLGGIPMYEPVGKVPSE